MRPTRSDGSGLTSTRSPTATAFVSRRAGELARDEQVVVAGDRVPGRAQPGRAERPLGAGEQARMARRVDVGAVVGGVGVVRALDAVVAGRAAVGPHEPAVERAPGLRHLVGLGVVDEVAVDDDGVGPGGVERADGGRQDLEGERLLRAEDGGERRPETVEEHRPGRGLLVADVDVGEDPDAAEHAPGRRRRTEVGAVAQRLAGAAAGACRRRRGRRTWRAASSRRPRRPPPSRHPTGRPRTPRRARAATAPRSDSTAMAAPAGHSSRSPATGGSATARRARPRRGGDRETDEAHDDERRLPALRPGG